MTRRTTKQISKQTGKTVIGHHFHSVLKAPNSQIERIGAIAQLESDVQQL